MTIGVLINPTSRRGKGAASGREALRLLRERGVDVVNLTAGSAEEAQRLAGDVAASGRLDALFAVGGDGTVHIGAQAVAGTGVPLGIIAVGTGNDVARHLGLPRLDVHAAVERAITALGRNQRRSIDLIGVGDQRALSVVCCGIDADVNHRSNSFAWPKSGLRYIRGIASSLAHFEPFGFGIDIDGTRIEGGTTLVSIANTSYIGAGIHVAPMAVDNDGMLDVIIAPGLNRAQILALLPRLARGSHIDHPSVHHIRGRRIELTVEERHGRKPPPIMADGDVVGHLPLVVECRPGELELLA